MATAICDYCGKRVSLLKRKTPTLRRHVCRSSRVTAYTTIKMHGKVRAGTEKE